MARTQKVAHEAIAQCVTDVLTTFGRLLRSVTDARKHGLMMMMNYIYVSMNLADANWRHKHKDKINNEYYLCYIILNETKPNINDVT